VKFLNPDPRPLKDSEYAYSLLGNLKGENYLIMEQEMDGIQFVLQKLRLKYGPSIFQKMG
jgi:hypothetical protein